MWLLNENREIGVCHKLQVAFVGPFVISEKYGKVNFRIQLNDSGKTRVVHHDKLKVYTGTNPPKWVTKLATKVIQSKTQKRDQDTQTDETDTNDLVN